MINHVLPRFIFRKIKKGAMMIQFTDYDRITDILMYLSNTITLNFNVVLSRKDKTGKRSFFHYETEYPSKYLGVNTGRGIKRNMNF